MARNLVMEPSTMIYTNLNPKILPKSDFSLIVRANHKFMVNEVIESEDGNSIQVKLGYQASCKNAISKLGDLAQIVSVTKASTLVKDSELSRLDELRRFFNMPVDAQETQAPQVTKFLSKPLALSRPAPYKKRAKKSKPSDASTSLFEEAQQLNNHTVDLSEDEGQVSE